MRVLLAEDEAIIALAMQDVLEEAGHEVVFAFDADWALSLALSRAAAGHPFDVVVTDLGLPGLAGEALIRRLRTRIPGQPVVAVTGSSPEGGLRELLRAGRGPLALLVKPVAPEAVLRAVRAVAAQAGGAAR